MERGFTGCLDEGGRASTDIYLPVADAFLQAICVPQHA
jgi:hypothetical protein